MTTGPLAPVTAAVDPSKMGGLDDAGKWHDPYGRFARRGMSAVKVALLNVLEGQRAEAAVRDAGPDGANLKVKPSFKLFDLIGAGPHRVVRHDHRYGKIVGDKPLLVRWTDFDESGLPDPPRVEQAPQPPRAPSYDEAQRRHRAWTGVIGDMEYLGGSEDDTRGDMAAGRALAAVPAGSFERIGAALEALPERAQQAFGVRSTEPLFPGGKLPDDVDFWFDYGIGFMAEAPLPTRVEDTQAYAAYRPILDRWRSDPEMFAKRSPGDFDPSAPITRDNEPFGGLVDDAEAEMADARKRRDSIPEDRKVRTREQAQAAAGRQFVRDMFSGWAENSLTMRSIIFQRAIADAFGLDHTHDNRAADDVHADAMSVYDAAPAAWQAYVKALYQQTQEGLAAAGIRDATLFRGSNGSTTDSPVSSWSVSPNIALTFGDTIRRATVPASDIFATPLLTGIGKSEEAEVVLLNRPRSEWVVRRPGDPALTPPDGRMFDIWFDYDQQNVQSPRPGWNPDFNDLVETPARPVPAEPWPSERLNGDLSYVTDTTVPWADRVARLATDRDRLADRLGPPTMWFRHPQPDTLDRVWGRGDGQVRLEERKALDRVRAITEYGTALASLVAERSEELSGGKPVRIYTPEASRAIVDAIEEFAPGSTIGPLQPRTVSNGGELGRWEGRDRPLAAWPKLIDGLRDGTTEIIVKKNEIILVGDDDGAVVRAKLAKRDYGGDHGGGYTERLPSGRNVYRRDTYGHAEIEVMSERQSYRNPTAWTRGTGTFDSLHKAVKGALDKSKKASADELSNPPTLRAWTETMEAMGVDMSTDPGVLVSSGAVQDHDVTVMAWGEAVQIQRPNWDAIDTAERTPLGELKASSAVAKTVNAGLAPYPRWWTSQLPPQHLHMPNSTSAKAGSAGNLRLPNSNYVITPSVVGHPQHASSAAHEFGHSMQKVIPAVHLAEAWSMIDRLSQHPGEDPTDVSRGRGLGYRDHFAEDYSGRVYLNALEPGQPEPDLTGGQAIPAVRTFEMVTTGVQSLYDMAGRRSNRNLGRDPELSGLTLGLMSLIRDPGQPAAPEFNDLPETRTAAPPRRGSAKAHEYLDAIEAEFGDPLPAEPGYEMQTPWYAREGPSVERSYDIDRFIEMAPRYSTPDTSESDRKFVTAVKAGMIALFEDMERAGKPSPRSPEVRAALRRVADALPDGVELQTGSQFYGGGPSSIGVPVEGIEGVADALERVAPILPEVHLDTVKLTESGYGNGQAYVFPRHDASSLAMASGIYKWPRALGASEKPWEQENYSATSHRDLTDKLITHEVGHLIQMELVRRSGVDLEPNKDRPRKVLGAMIDDAMARLSKLADEHPALFQAATGQEPGNHSSHALTASALANYSGQDAAEFIAEAFAMAVAGNYLDRPITRQTPIEWSARAAFTNLTATTLWREAFGDLPLPGAMSRDFPDDWDDQRIAGALLGGIIPPGWTRARIEALAAAEGTPPATRAALEALAAKMEP